MTGCDNFNGPHRMKTLATRAAAAVVDAPPASCQSLCQLIRFANNLQQLHMSPTDRDVRRLNRVLIETLRLSAERRFPMKFNTQKVDRDRERENENEALRGD